MRVFDDTERREKRLGYIKNLRVIFGYAGATPLQLATRCSTSRRRCDSRFYTIFELR